ncbi:hypothetical protein ABB37_08207 [Leptomonas pyrrhocoris]|uniref:Uncharacterized protein n=1 Tax=Leptomonas pyrrhocoris TaxID=157538 RepID=A0A0N0VDN1_LEPPY|nr:hypothetical protein ABB37_08207 [Leptomonas pyrrhocoris]KPA76078.1 hypothetical protein ABB37_08207 [Leptomonas pyrrhocoris]|eukprot:XP_015654517.1 hypothetical protein ABB37_08207 [Leptomonas pyrrhocoris]
MRRCLAFRRHPYAIDPKILQEKQQQEQLPRKLSLREIGANSARQAWRKTRSVYDFFVLDGPRGGPGK